MKEPFRIAFAQINATVGALDGNRRKMEAFLTRAKEQGADLVLFPELALTGYPPEDLLFKPSFVRDNLAGIRRLIPASRGLACVIGYVDRDLHGKLYNAAAVMADGRLLGSYHKIHLPNYGVFDEKRYFASGASPMLLDEGQRKIGISICEDIWVEQSPCAAQARAGAKVLVNISASPYHTGKRLQREGLLRRRAQSYQAYVCYVNLVGGQDELIFDGDSMVADPKGKIVFRAPQFEEGLYLYDIPAARQKPRLSLSKPLDEDEEIFRALVTGTRDYVRKNRFSHVVIGLSGGIDSALTAAIAVAALGKEAVTGVSMPSRYSSAGTRADARRLARNLKIQFMEISIEPVFKAALKTLTKALKVEPTGLTAENLQARIRGTLLMALSNRFGWLVLATGNKSEISTGYTTLYGDMVGGFAVIKDLPKTKVYKVCRVANKFLGKGVIPESTFQRAPSAELRPRQTDQDTLPPYPVLDAVIREYVEERRPASEIKKRVAASQIDLQRVFHMIDIHEYKRRQAPIGIKLTPLAFGKDRRMPITNHYREAI